MSRNSQLAGILVVGFVLSVMGSELQSRVAYAQLGGPGLAGGSRTVSSANTGVAANAKLCLDAPTCTRYMSYNSGSNRLELVATASEFFSFNRNVEFNSSAQFYATATFTGASAALVLGTSGTAISDSFAAASTIDFASSSNTTVNSSNITVTGAAVGDTCEVGPPTAAMVTGASFTCYVSAADTVIVRFTAVGASIDPASGSFNIRVFDP